jgi:GDP-D-mannose dehydratase
MNSDTSNQRVPVSDSAQMKKALITGLMKQDGIFLAQFLQNKGYQVFRVSLSGSPYRMKLLRKVAADSDVRRDWGYAKDFV